MITLVVCVDDDDREWVWKAVDIKIGKPSAATTRKSLSATFQYNEVRKITDLQF